MGIARHMSGLSGLSGIAGLAVLCAMGGASIPKAERKPMRYREFCGPPHPKSRQHLRQLMREAKKAGAAL